MTTIHDVRRLLAATMLAGLGLTMAACNDGNAAQPPATETVTVNAESDSGDSATSSAEPAADDSEASGHIGTQLPDNWPDQDFPLPPDVTVQVKADTPDETAIVLVGQSPADIADFYRSALPAAGYEITNDQSVNAPGQTIVDLDFTGQGYDGEVAVVSNHVVISLDEQ
ncbi:hypothetical protein [Actinophytocola sp.]|uniref:hypothetical protein n=1 Tax=Actinophytocola sp. TaxID=1872138 RepID=UPI003D6C3084